MSARIWWVVGASAVLFVSTVAAQTVYTWRDDKGVVHFADEKPAGVKTETLTLEAPVPMISESGGDTPPAGEGAEGLVVNPAGAPGGAPPEAAQPLPTGPSEVVFLGAELANVGTTQRRVRGKLRNVGGVPANHVSVRVVIADGDTGNLCITTELDAQPTLFGVGETGTFEGNLDTPCFYGNPTISYYPEWD